MGKEIRISYDKEGDILDISLGLPREAVSREIEDDLFVRMDPVTKEIVGFSVINFEKWFAQVKDFKQLPIEGDLRFSEAGA
jgi:uncharacterized protein YuzE